MPEVCDSSLTAMAFRSIIRAMTGRLVTHLPEVETPRLVVRELHPGDVHDFSAFMLRAEYQRHLAVQYRNVESLRSFVLRAISRQDQEGRTSFHLAGELKTRGAAIADGFVQVGPKGLVEVGWGVSPPYWGRGIGTELARALFAMAFERLDAERVWCKVMAPNAASLKLARRVGMKPWRSKPEFPVGQGRFEEVDFFILTADDYFEAPY
jgi:ribosomal-protein-alanine N-acetyltransferase